MAPKRTTSTKRAAPSSAPDHLEVGTGASRRSIARVEDLYAVHHVAPGTPLDRAVLTLDDGEIAVFRQAAGERREHDASREGPVYELHPGGSVGVPTGLVFVRFASSERVEQHRDDLTRAGYDVQRVLSYAPNAAWLKPSSDRIEDGLRGIDALWHIEGIENVEAELKMPRSMRDASQL